MPLHKRQTNKKTQHCCAAWRIFIPARRFKQSGSKTMHKLNESPGGTCMPARRFLGRTLKTRKTVHTRQRIHAHMIIQGTIWWVRLLARENNSPYLDFPLSNPNWWVCLEAKPPPHLFAPVTLFLPSNSSMQYAHTRILLPRFLLSFQVSLSPITRTLSHLLLS